MLVIRKEQIDRMRQAAIQDFIRDLADHLEKRAGAARDVCLHELPATVAEAREWGFVRECDVVEFCEFLYLCTGTLDLTKLPRRAQNILLEFGEDPPEKLRRFKTWMEGHERLRERHA